MKTLKEEVADSIIDFPQIIDRGMSLVLADKLIAKFVAKMPEELSKLEVYRNNKLLKKATALLKSKREGWNSYRQEMLKRVGVEK